MCVSVCLFMYMYIWVRCMFACMAHGSITHMKGWPENKMVAPINVLAFTHRSFHHAADSSVHKTKNRVEAILRWRIHCSGPDFTYDVSKFYGVICTWSCVQGVCMCREACRLTRISCYIGRVPKWRLYKRHW